jgi:hypothetical protein
MYKGKRRGGGYETKGWVKGNGKGYIVATITIKYLFVCV